MQAISLHVARWTHLASATQTKATNRKKVQTRGGARLDRGKASRLAHYNIRIASSPIRVIYQLNNKWYIMKHPFGNNRKSTKPTAHILRTQRTIWTHPESESPIMREYFRYFAKINEWIKAERKTEKYAVFLCNLFSFFIPSECPRIRDLPHSPLYNLNTCLID